MPDHTPSVSIGIADFAQKSRACLKRFSGQIHAYIETGALPDDAIASFAILTDQIVLYLDHFGPFDLLWLPTVAEALRNHAPRQCWGDVAAVNDWKAKGGREGYLLRGLALDDGERRWPGL